MSNFPTISSPSAFSEERRKGTIKTTFENGKVASRPKWTLGKKSFELNWAMMSNADKVILDNFFESTNGLAFVYTHPKTSTTYSVIFTDDTLKFDYIQAFDSSGVSMWSVKLNLLEV
jgi:hypothetical protein